jgi:exodeoxyribonuclease III
LNRGWRIDYVIVSEESVGAIIEAEIRDKVKGSDHCPVDLLIDLDKLG